MLIIQLRELLTSGQDNYCTTFPKSGDFHCSNVNSNVINDTNIKV